MTPNNLPGRKWRALIADDVQETRRSTRLMLSTFDNIEVVAIAVNGLQAVEMTKQYRPDILFMDVNMPEMDGLLAYSQIAKLFPDIACIIISAENDSITLNMAEILGVQAYLTKPFTLDELEKSITFVTQKLSELRAKNPQPQQDLAAELERLATECVKARRTDDQAVKIFEKLAENPNCNIYWLKNMAMIYAIRQDWGKLKTLAERLERVTKK
jgi:YesN/AraC family two-component response regulator